MTHTTDVDSLMYQYQEADHLRREGWQVVPPEQAEKRNRLCLDASCLTRIPPPRQLCWFHKKSRRLGIRRRLGIAA